MFRASKGQADVCTFVFEAMLILHCRLFVFTFEKNGEHTLMEPVVGVEFGHHRWKVSCES